MPALAIAAPRAVASARNAGSFPKADPQKTATRREGLDELVILHSEKRDPSRITGCIQNNGIRALSPFSAADLLCHACIYGKQRQRQEGSQEGSQAEAETRTRTQARDLLTAATAKVEAVQAPDRCARLVLRPHCRLRKSVDNRSVKSAYEVQQQKGHPLGWPSALLQVVTQIQGCAAAPGLISARACALSASTLCALSSSAWASGI